MCQYRSGDRTWKIDTPKIRPANRRAKTTVRLFTIVRVRRCGESSGGLSAVRVPGRSGLGRIGDGITNVPEVPEVPEVPKVPKVPKVPEVRGRFEPCPQTSNL